MSRSVRLSAVFALLALLVAACGQKDGVHVAFPPGADLAPQAGLDEPDDFAMEGAEPFMSDESDFAADFDDPFDAEQPEVADGGATVAAPAAPRGGQTAARSGQQPAASGGGGQPTGTQPEDGGQAAPADGQAAQSAQPAQQGDSTGITDTVIKVGGHAPLTGAAPLPQRSFMTGKDLYWNHRGGLFGRTVETIIRDDQYNPSRATSVCNEMIQRDKVFLLLGGGGADQIAACARTAAQQGVPYVSAGVDEGVLRRLPNYFAFSMSYVQQAELLIDYVDKHAKPANNRLAIVRDRTPSFDNALRRFEELGRARGYEVVVRQTQNGPSDGQWLAQHEIQTAFPLMAPSQWVQIVNSPGGDIANWVGVGITMGLNTVLSAGCPAIHGAMFFSPFPGLNQVDRLDPEFFAAGGEDDIELALWGISRVLHEVFEFMGEDNLTRQAFVRAMQSNVIETTVYPTLRHTPDDHFRATSVHVLRADCARRQYVTHDDGLFRSSF